jgi:hypothetical protein
MTLDLNQRLLIVDKTPMVLSVDTASTSYHVGQAVGLVVVLVLAGAVVRRALTVGLGRVRNRLRDRWIAAGAALVAGAFLVSAANAGIFNSGSGSAWSSQRGIEIRAGFIAGCANGRTDVVAICECAFRHMTAIPAYDTPDRFEAVVPTFRRALVDHSASDLPPDLVAAVRSCVTRAGRS